MADAAMKQSDTNGDGILDAKELAAAPGLKAAAEAQGGSADKNGDGQLTKDEVRERIAYYEQTAIGITNAPVELFLAKRPLAGATVELVPEGFLEGVLDVATATTQENGFGVPSIQGEPVEGVRPGMYRIVITSSSAQVPTKYTDKETTPLGVEVIPAREGYGPGKRRFDLDGP
jgi:hypothetical protein